MNGFATCSSTEATAIQCCFAIANGLLGKTQNPRLPTAIPTERRPVGAVSLALSAYELALENLDGAVLFEERDFLEERADVRKRSAVF
jgi:hypothetical protein